MKVLMIQTYRNSVKELYEVTTISCKRYCLENSIDYIGVNLSEILVKKPLINTDVIDNDDNWYKFLLLNFINYHNYDYLIIINHTMMFQNYNYNIQRELSFNKNFIFLESNSDELANYNFIIIKVLSIGHLKQSLFLFERLHSHKVNKYSYFLERLFIETNTCFVENNSFILQLDDDYSKSLNIARQLTYSKLIKSNL